MDAICGIWKESASRLQRRCRLKMLTDGRRIPVYTISSLMSLRQGELKKREKVRGWGGQGSQVGGVRVDVNGEVKLL